MSKVSGDMLRKLREEKNEIQEQISKLLGFKAKQAYSAVEAGRDLSFENLIKVAKHFNVTTDYIIGASPYRTIEDEKLAIQTRPESPHDSATVDAITIIKTANLLLEKYGEDGKVIQDRLLGPLAELCDIVQKQASYVTYAGDTMSGENFPYFSDLLSGENYRKANESCQKILKGGF